MRKSLVILVAVVLACGVMTSGCATTRAAKTVRDATEIGNPSIPTKAAGSLTGSMATRGASKAGAVSVGVVGKVEWNVFPMPVGKVFEPLLASRLYRYTAKEFVTDKEGGTVVIRGAVEEDISSSKAAFQVEMTAEKWVKVKDDDYAYFDVGDPMKQLGAPLGIVKLGDVDYPFYIPKGVIGRD